MLFTKNRTRLLIVNRILLGLLVFPFCGCQQSTPLPKRILRFHQPANHFEEALPLGNGRIGAMVYGEVTTEKFSLNEETLWAGGPVDAYQNPKAYEHLPAVRKALFEEDYPTSDQLVRKIQGKFSESYAPLGTLYLDFQHGSESSTYQRTLNLRNAISQVSYTIDNTTYSRESFISFPDQVMVIRLKADGPQKLNVSLRSDSKLKYRSGVSENNLILQGFAPSHAEPNYRGDMPNAVVYDEQNSMRFLMIGHVAATDGEVTAEDSVLHVSHATEVNILVSLATSYNGFDKNPGLEGVDEHAKAKSLLEKAAKFSYEELKKRHVADYRSYFDRVSIDLGPQVNTGKSTASRLKQFTKTADDNDLVALYYQFSRYLLISSSRPGGIPANLQGIWNESVRPPWSSNFTTNINAEMNYWPAEVANLSEMHEPLLDFIENLAVSGAVTARTFYDCGGWCCHHNTDIWAMTNPVGDFGQGHPVWANWNMGGVWLSTHLWEHFAFTRDTVFLKNRAYPLIKGAAQFCLDYLTEDQNGHLVTAPSTSPENLYVMPNGYKGATFYGATADMAMINELFHNIIKASEIIETDAEFIHKVKQTQSKLAPYKTGKKGQLLEWYHDWDDADPKHRHVSHLFGLYPGRSITMAQTPELSKASKRSLELRTNNGTGWSIAWKIGLWARLRDGAMSFDAIKKLLTYYNTDNSTNYHGGGTYPNLFCAHPPFQIDGNFGALAGISEMLLQSHHEVIDLLPALPKAWKTGNIKGLKARGGYTVDIYWNDGKLEKASVTPDYDGPFEVKYKDKTMTLEGQQGKITQVRF